MPGILLFRKIIPAAVGIAVTKLMMGPEDSLKLHKKIPFSVFYIVAFVFKNHFIVSCIFKFAYKIVFELPALSSPYCNPECFSPLFDIYYLGFALIIWYVKISSSF